jgi:hypothetical protein
MGMIDSLVGQLTSKFGVSGDQAKGALDKILPFVQGKLGGMSLPGLPGGLGGGGDVGLLSKIDLHHPTAAAHGSKLLEHVDPAEQEAHVQEVAKQTGLDPDIVRKMMPAAAAALHADGHLDPK